MPWTVTAFIDLVAPHRHQLLMAFSCCQPWALYRRRTAIYHPWKKTTVPAGAKMISLLSLISSSPSANVVCTFIKINLRLAEETASGWWCYSCSSRGWCFVVHLSPIVVFLADVAPVCLLVCLCRLFSNYLRLLRFSCCFAVSISLYFCVCVSSSTFLYVCMRLRLLLSTSCLYPCLCFCLISVSILSLCLSVKCYTDNCLYVSLYLCLSLHVPLPITQSPFPFAYTTLALTKETVCEKEISTET